MGTFDVAGREDGHPRALRKRGKMDSKRNRLAYCIATAVISAGVFMSAGPRAMAQVPSAQPSITGDDARSVHLGVGKTKLIEAPWPVSRVSVSNPEIADVEVLSPHQVLLMGNAVGVTDLILWNEDEEAWRARVSRSAAVVERPSAAAARASSSRVTPSKAAQIHEKLKPSRFRQRSRASSSACGPAPALHWPARACTRRCPPPRARRRPFRCAAA